MHTFRKSVDNFEIAHKTCYVKVRGALPLNSKMYIKIGHSVRNVHNFCCCGPNSYIIGFFPLHTIVMVITAPFFIKMSCKVNQNVNWQNLVHVVNRFRVKGVPLYMILFS